MTFEDGNKTLGTGKLSTAAGVATVTFTTGSLAVGDHSLTAVYPGDENFTGSSSSPVTQSVAQAGTKTTLLASPALPVFGQEVTFTATVSAIERGSGTPTGTVTFLDGRATLGTGSLSTVKGVTTATFSTRSLSVGDHSITATCAGDAHFSASTSDPLTESVLKADTTTKAYVSVSRSVSGQQVTFTATVSAAGPGSGTPTGVVTFNEDYATLDTSIPTIVNGVLTAKFSTFGLALGKHQITASYTGDDDFNASTSGPVTEMVNQANTTTTVRASVNPSSFGQQVTFTATVNVTTPGSGVPTGTVTFKDGNKTLGTGTLGTVKGVTTASFSTGELGAGSHKITANYAGDGHVNASVSKVLTQVVHKSTLAMPAFGRLDSGSPVARSVLGSYQPPTSPTNRSTAPYANDVALLSLMGASNGHDQTDQWP